jgi:hypothetical protein
LQKGLFFYCFAMMFAIARRIEENSPLFRGVAAKLTGCSRQRRPPVYLRVFANLVALNTPRPSGTPLQEGNKHTRTFGKDIVDGHLC